MSFAIQNSAKRYINIADFPTTDVRANMVGEYILGGTLENSAINTADKTKPLALHSGNTGAVVYGTNFATVKDGGYYAGYVAAGFDTGIYLGPKSYTLIQISRGSRSALWSEGSDNNYFGMLYYGGRLCVYNSNSGTLDAVPDLPTSIADDSKFAFTAARMPYLGVSKLYRYDGGVLSSSEEGNVGGTRDTSKTIRIAGAGNYLYAPINPVTDVAYVAIYEKALTDGEIAEIYSDLKTYFANYRGLNIS